MRKPRHPWYQAGWDAAHRGEPVTAISARGGVGRRNSRLWCEGWDAARTFLHENPWAEPLVDPRNVSIGKIRGLA